jgi:hypothetical protein
MRGASGRLLRVAHCDTDGGRVTTRRGSSARAMPWGPRNHRQVAHRRDREASDEVPAIGVEVDAGHVDDAVLLALPAACELPAFEHLGLDVEPRGEVRRHVLEIALDHVPRPERTTVAMCRDLDGHAVLVFVGDLHGVAGVAVVVGVVPAVERDARPLVLQRSMQRQAERIE